MKAIKFTLILAGLFIISSCTVYENDIEADVDLVYSSTITIRANDFIHEDEFVSVASYGWDNLDEYMVDQGLVMGYLRFEGTTAWQALPFSVPYENDLVNLRYSFDVEDFSLIIEGEVADNNNANVALFDRDVLRVIAIPPSEIVRSKGMDYRNYEMVAEYYGLDP
ncbi:hypothetical protein [Gracilimonas mengyeensis]|uniref:Uncharacterized protein n=1 Tax=Gracilimonas mengyeensis TaxID=1302730 RepID=A0A521AMB2_9BACT|nr:hypothetical protein [Gracilimonas mengyeensis]SMO35946.1 hypothetical protein SAMN06265219_101236 [Gracilimonas mengyeensis]